MDRTDISDKKSEIIRATWEYLLKKGLSCASIGELCKEAKLSQSSLYYWFENKDDIWISAGKYGIAKVVDALLAYTSAHANDIRGYFDTLLDMTEKYKYDLRLAVQITTSPVYGERMREKAHDFHDGYAKYAEQIIGTFGCTALQAETFIYSVIAFVIDYAIWDDREKTQMLLDNLYLRVTGFIDTKGSNQCKIL